VSVRGWAGATAIAGLITLALFVVFALLPEMQAVGTCLARGAVVQFEFARNAADLEAIFGPPGGACRALGAAAMDAVNRIDLIAFIPAYTAFCISGALYLAAGQWGRPLAAAAVAAAVLAALADVLETNALLDITQDFDAAAAHLPLSQLGAWSKFALLAAHALFCAGLCLIGEKRRWIVGIALVLPTLGIALAALDHVQFAGVMSASFAIAWLALLGATTLASLQSRRT